MSTPNFYYKNRCIVVTDEDYDNDNYPHSEDRPHYQALRSYPSYKLVEQPPECGILVAVLTAGYYSGACLDYITEPYDGATDEEIEQAIEQEGPIMNAFLDKIKEDYGYKEMRCVAVASNGEAFYREV